LVTALEAGFPPAQILVSGPDKSPGMLHHLRSLPESLVSLDSVNELEMLANRSHGQRVLLRLRPDFCSVPQCAAGPGSRFSIPLEHLPRCREYIASAAAPIVGFHVFSGSQVLDAAGVAHHLRGGLELSLRAAEALGMTPEVIDLGGGFGIP